MDGWDGMGRHERREECGLDAASLTPKHLTTDNYVSFIHAF